MHILQEVKVILKPSICLWAFIGDFLGWKWQPVVSWLLVVRNSATAAPVLYYFAWGSPTSLGHVCHVRVSVLSRSPAGITYGHPVQPSCWGNGLHAIRVGMESEALQTIHFLSGPVFFYCQGYVWPHGHFILMVICQAMTLQSKVLPNIEENWLFNGLMDST